MSEKDYLAPSNHKYGSLDPMKTTGNGNAGESLLSDGTKNQESNAQSHNQGQTNGSTEAIEEDDSGLCHYSTWEDIADSKLSSEPQPGCLSLCWRLCGCCGPETSKTEHNLPETTTMSNLPHVLVLLNQRSGGGCYARTMQKMLKMPSAVTIIELQKLCKDPVALHTQVTTCIRTQGKLNGVRVVSAGGDGTVTWAADLVEAACAELDIPKVPLAMMPLGTGNEMSKCTGWGASWTSSRVSKFLTAVSTRPFRSVDTWTCHFDPTDEMAPIEEGKSEKKGATGGSKKQMLCFFSAGFDARIAYEYHCAHRLRKDGSSKEGEVHTNITAIKAWHVWYGLKELVAQENYVQGDHGLPGMELRVDGAVVKIPGGVNTIQVFNIHSSADGCDFFGLGQKSSSNELQHYSPPTMGDSLLEVVGTSGVIDTVAIRLGMFHSHRIAQGSEVELRLRRPTPVQLDGEPHLQAPCTVRISARSKLPVVVGPGRTRGVPDHHAPLDMKRPSVFNAGVV